MTKEQYIWWGKIGERNQQSRLVHLRCLLGIHVKLSDKKQNTELKKEVQGEYINFSVISKNAIKSLELNKSIQVKYM
jgi:hypothetical protein